MTKISPGGSVHRRPTPDIPVNLLLDSDKPVTPGLVWTFRANRINLIENVFFIYRKGQDLDSSVLDFVSWVLLVSTAKKESVNQRMIVNEYACTDTNS